MSTLTSARSYVSLIWLTAGIACSSGPATSGRSAAEPASWELQVEPLATPANPDSSAPHLDASSGGVVLSWVEQDANGRTSRLKFARRTAGGWTAPVTVASGDDWFVSYADPPGVTQLSDGTLVAHWLVVTDLIKEASDLHLAYSTDQGKTWTPSFLPHHDGTASQHAFASFVELPGRTLGLAWLDGRGGDMSLRYTTFDAQWRQGMESVIDSRVCECCQTALAATPQGPIVAYRDRGDSEIRDIHVSRLEGRAWSADRAVAADNWQVDYCPINGPALGTWGERAVVTWFTVKNDRGQAYAAFSSDAGRTWGQPIRLDDEGSIGRVDVEFLDDGSAVATWVELAAPRAQLRVRRIRPSGERSPASAVAEVPSSASSGFSRMVRRGDELLFAWTESGAGESGGAPPIVRTGVARLPRD
jgi:hypothetical protein